MKDKQKILVAYFSHTGENYAVGNIEKGNTHIVAELIAEATGGRLFEIVPETAYPKTYDDCVSVARKEKAAGARPAVVSDAAVEDYDTVFIGYPNWCSDLPMPVYTFIDKHDWTGKTVLPFCTHEGSGLSDTEALLAGACAGARIAKGLAVKGTAAQRAPQQVETTIRSWLRNTEL